MIELLVVMASLAVLLAVAAPRYIAHVDHARDVALKENLWRMRDAIDKFHGDQGRLPTSLQELVERQYLRALPVDPVTERKDTWIPVAEATGAGRGIRDVKSGARGPARDGTSYEAW